MLVRALVPAWALGLAQVSGPGLERALAFVPEAPECAAVFSVRCYCF